MSRKQVRAINTLLLIAAFAALTATTAAIVMVYSSGILK